VNARAKIRIQLSGKVFEKSSTTPNTFQRTKDFDYYREATPLMNSFLTRKAVFLRAAAFVLLGASMAGAQAAPQSTPDVLVLVNGDTLHGKLVKAIGGAVTFHSDIIGDVTVTWDKIKELHSSQQFAIIPKGVELQGKKKASQVPVGTVDVTNQTLTVTGKNVPAEPIPLGNAAFIVDEPTVDKLLHHEPSFLQGWNGAATAGATIVAASQNQYTVSASVGLVRTVPNVPWLNARNRTSVDFSTSYGKITQPAYTIPGETPTYVPAVVTKTSILHADAEHDWYFSPRMYALAMTAFDHNYAQGLDLQQIYGGGLGYTVLKSPKQQLDVKATVQYEKQSFDDDTGDNLVGSTFGALYQRHSKLFNFTQGLSYIPAYNDFNAWSANETDTLAFPAYKNLSFSLGTLDTYINNPPAGYPPTKANSFQFTMGFTYAIKSKY
jgi:hypothetical protein